jgi:hypothetical protein
VRTAGPAPARSGQSVLSRPADSFAEHEGGEDREAGALGGFGGVPDLVQVLPQSSSRGQKVRRRFAVAYNGTMATPSAEKTSSFRLAGRLRRSLAGPAPNSFHHRGRKEDQRGYYGAQAHRFERSACFGPDIGPWRWWRRIEMERFRHMVPPENLKIDCVPAEYPDDPADSPQPSHRHISGRCRCCMHLVYHGYWLATCLPAAFARRHQGRRRLHADRLRRGKTHPTGWKRRIVILPAFPAKSATCA